MITLESISNVVNPTLEPLTMISSELQNKRKIASLLQSRIACMSESFAAVNIDDGSILILGKLSKYQSELSKWKNFCSVALGEKHIVGLRCDGSLVAVGKSDKLYNQCDVFNVTDAELIGCTKNENYFASKGTLLKTIKASKYNPDEHCENVFDHLSNYLEGVVQIATSDFHWAALKSDGTVFSESLQDFDYEEKNVTDNWTNIVQIACSNEAVFGLKRDGTVVFTAKDEKTKENLSYVLDWQNIVSIAAGSYSSGVMGLRSDGTVTGKKDWSDIVAIAGTWSYWYGIDKNGVLYTTNSSIPSGKHTLTLFHDRNKVEYEVEKSKEKGRASLKQAKEYIEKGLCQYCGGELTGILAKKCSNCGRKKDY